MINLLLEQDKKYLFLDSIQRKILIVSLAFSVALLVLVLLFFCFRAYLNDKAEVLDVQIQEKQVELQSVQLENFKEAVAKINQDFAQINSAWKRQDMITPVFEKIYTLTPNVVYFEAFSFMEEEIKIAGVAQTRDALLSFKEQLEGVEMFSNIYFAPFSWTQATDAGFSVTFNHSSLAQ